MKSATALLLTLCLSGALVQVQAASQSDICTELGKLTNTTEKLSLVESSLAATESKVQAQETSVEALRAELDVAKTELLQYKEKLDGMEKKLAGIFTAPVKGAYYFRFNVMDNRKSNHMGAALYKNNQRVLQNYAWNHWDDHERVSNAVVLELSQGDTVYVRLPVAYRVHEFSDYNFNIFSGFLLFPM